METALSFEAALDHRMTELWKILMDRHAKYGARNLERRGMLGILTRMEDKIGRIEQAVGYTNDAARWEVMDDALLDLAGYAIMGLMLEHRQLGGTSA